MLISVYERKYLLLSDQMAHLIKNNLKTIQEFSL